MAGALAYSELGAMFPRAGGQYHFLKEAYGPLWGFLFGWTSFLVIMTGGIAAIAVGFGEYLGGFLPVFSADTEILSWDWGAHRWTVQGPQLAGALAIVLLTGVNWLGVREGAMVQNAATVLKVAALAALTAIGLIVPMPSAPAWWAPVPPGSLGVGLGLGMVAVLWTYDGWYVLTFSAGEMRRPERNLPRGLVGGVAVVTALYLAINWVYVRALDLTELGRASRVGESAAVALLGPGAARAVAVVILLSMFGCLAANVLCCAPHLPADGPGRVFFRSLARVDPRHHTPSTSLLAQGAGRGARALRNLRRALHHRGVRRRSLPRRHRGRRVRPPAPAARRAEAVPCLGAPLADRHLRRRVPGTARWSASSRRRSAVAAGDRAHRQRTAGVRPGGPAPEDQFTPPESTPGGFHLASRARAPVASGAHDPGSPSPARPPLRPSARLPQRSRRPLPPRPPPALRCTASTSPTWTARSAPGTTSSPTRTGPG